METVQLKHTDLKVSKAAFGTMPFGTQADEAECRRMVDCCIDHGINFFDTANVYNKGLAETVLGNVLKGRRDRVVLASKVGFPMGDEPDRKGLSRAAILRAIDESLARLQTDYLDLYYMHAPDWNTPLEESLEVIDQLVRAGKVRYPANSNFASWQVVQMLWVSDKKSYRPPYVSQPMYNVLARGIEQEYLAMCKRYGISAIVYNPLAGGLLTGKQPQQEPIAGTRFDKNQLYLDRYWHQAYFEAVEKLRAAGEKEGRSLIDISLNWLLHHTASDCIILGASKMPQLEQNLEVFEKGGPLSAELLAACEQVWQDLRGITPKYNR